MQIEAFLESITDPSETAGAGAHLREHNLD